MKGIKRFSVPVSCELEARVANLRRTDRFCRESFAEIVRELMIMGLDMLEEDRGESEREGA
jgi:hypothetical protein